MHDLWSSNLVVLIPCDETFLTPFTILLMKYLENVREHVEICMEVPPLIWKCFVPRAMNVFLFIFVQQVVPSHIFFNETNSIHKKLLLVFSQ